MHVFILILKFIIVCAVNFCGFLDTFGQGLVGSGVWVVLKWRLDGCLGFIVCLFVVAVSFVDGKSYCLRIGQLIKFVV